MSFWKWTPWPREYHEEILEHVRNGCGGTLPDWAIEADLVYLADREARPHDPKRVPGRRALQKRWAVKERQARRCLRSSTWQLVCDALGIPLPARHRIPGVPVGVPRPSPSVSRHDTGQPGFSGENVPVGVPRPSPSVSTRAEIDPRSRSHDPCLPTEDDQVSSSDPLLADCDVKATVNGWRVISDKKGIQAAEARQMAKRDPATQASGRPAPQGILGGLEGMENERTVAQPSKPKRKRKSRSARTAELGEHDRFATALSYWNDTVVAEAGERAPEAQFIRHPRTTHRSKGLGELLNVKLHEGAFVDVMLLMEWYAYAPAHQRGKVQWWRERGIDLVSLLRDNYTQLLEYALAWKDAGKPQTLTRSPSTKRAPAADAADAAAERLARFRAERAQRKAAADGGSHGA